jgi:hypothetical protein
LHALTLKNLEGLDKKQVRDQAYEIDKEKPKDYDVWLSKVKKYIRARNQEKAHQRNRKKTINKEVPPAASANTGGN